MYLPLISHLFLSLIPNRNLLFSSTDLSYSTSRHSCAHGTPSLYQPVPLMLHSDQEYLHNILLYVEVQADINILILRIEQILNTTTYSSPDTRSAVQPVDTPIHTTQRSAQIDFAIQLRALQRKQRNLHHILTQITPMLEKEWTFAFASTILSKNLLHSMA